MATYKTTFATAQDKRSYDRSSQPSARDVQQPLNFAVFSFTLTAALVANDILKLGSIEVDGAVIVPELCRIVGSSASAKFNATIQSVTNGAAAVSESGAITHNGASAKHTAFTRTAAGTNTSLSTGKPDVAGTYTGSTLQLLIETVASFAGGAADDTLQVEIAYRTPKGCC
jgi:type IV secretory pathway TrbL component